MSKAMNARLLAGYEFHTPPDQAHQLESLSTEREHLKQTLKTYRDRREVLYERMGRPNPTNLKKWRGLEHTHRHARELREYFDLGSKMKEICGRMAEIRDELQRRSDTTFPSMFVDVARQLLPEEEFERIKRYTLFRLNEIYDQVD